MTSDQSVRLAVLIPAYKPSAGLIELLEKLSANPWPIIVVDDGSGPEFRSVFDRAAQFPAVRLLRHAVNLGKGAALKTAFNHVLCTYPNLAGVVTADADGQHDPDDIARVAGSLLANPDSLVLGSRRFGEDVPLRSRFGNIATRSVMHALLGRKITDTQTGLRGIPATLLPRLLRMESTGYEFELEMLIAAHHLSIPIVEEPIRTIYEAGNKSSHFNPIIDSMKIYFVLLRFGSVSAMTALLDNLIFIIVFHRTGNVLGSQIVGRFFAVIFNYTMVRTSVFYTKEQHTKVLPKYLGLVVASGAASYGGIRLLSSQLGVNPIAAKILVETLLFFVNFAVQRLFIFRPNGGSPRDSTQQPGSPRTSGAFFFGAFFAIAFAGLLAAEVYGLLDPKLWSQEIWYPVGLRRFTRYLGTFLALAIPLLVLVPWTFAGVIAALLLALTVISVGAAPAAASAFFLISACALGSRLFGRTKQDGVTSHLCATVTGTAVYICLMTLTARTPVHYPWTWGALLAVPIVADWRGVFRRLAFWTRAVFAAELRGGWTRLAFATLVFLLIAQWFVALKPETSADGLAMHLAIPANIAEHHRLTFEPAVFLWSVMPMGADWAYFIVYLLGGEYAARILNFAMLLIVVGLLYEAARRFVSPAMAYLLAASFAAMPVAQLVTGSMFVENFVAALTLGLLTTIWEFGRTGERRYLWMATIVAGAAVTTKLGSIAIVLLALPFLIAEVARRWRDLGRRPAAVCTAAAVLLIATAAPTYVIAYSKTGNPIFPFNNTKIHSPLLDPTVDLNDGRFHIPLDHSTLYTLTFRSSEAYEGQNGSFGFQYLVVAPLALLGLFVLSKNRVAVSCAVVGWGAGLIVMISQPNIRYLYAALPPLLILFAATLGWLRRNQVWLYRAIAVFLFAATGLDAYFLPSSSYYHKDFCLRLPFSRAERERFKAQAAPVRAVVDFFNRNHSGSTVLYTAGNEIAGLRGTVYENHWHQWPMLAALKNTIDPAQTLHVLQQWGVRYLIAVKPSAGEPVRPPSLQKLMAACATPEYQIADVYLARLEPDCADRVQAMRPPDRPALVLTPGYYDDFDPTLLFRGDWSHDESFAEPARHTVSYTDIPGAEVMVAFEGRALLYVFTKAPNRGVASIVIDGVEKARVDLYASRVEWQKWERFPVTPGKHLAIVRVTGEHDPKSTGKFVDVDAFVVE